MKIKNFAMTLTLVGAAVISTTSCSGAKDPSAEIGVSVAPTRAYVVAGKGSSCVAQAAAKAADSTPANDLNGDRVQFTRFALQWRSDDKLTIASITATFFSAGISGAETNDGLVKTMDEGEIAAMLGLSGLTIPYFYPYSTTGTPNRAITIDSTDATAKGKTYAACGFQVGGLASATGVKTYNARVKIEVIGFKTKCELQTDGTCHDGEQTPVRQSVTVSAQKY